MTTNELTSIFSTKNKYKVAEERSSNNGFAQNQIVIGVHRRVSTDRQVVEGDSLEMQSELAESHAKKIGGIVFRYYTEEGLSAKKTELKKRPVMQEIIQDIEDGKINYLIAYRRDRLFRNQAENMWFWSLLAEHDCQIYLTATGETQVKVEELKKAGTTKMMESILAMMAEMESEITSTRVADVMLSKAQRGEYTGGSIPLGYTRDEEGNFIHIDGAKEIIYNIEELYLQGYGLNSISRWLNGAEVKGLPLLNERVPKPLHEGDNNTAWSHRNINSILFNPFYSGNLSYESKKNTDIERVIVPLSSIVPYRTLERQRQLSDFKSNKNIVQPKRYDTEFVFSGILTCGHCGEKLNTYTSSRKDIRYSYYRCPTNMGFKHSSGGECKTKGFRKESVEIVLVKTIGDYLKELINYDISKKLEKAALSDNSNFLNGYQKIEKDIEKKQKSLNKITKIITKLDDNEDDLMSMYLKEQKEILIQINELKESLTNVSNSSTNNLVKYDYLGLNELINNYGEIFEVTSTRIKKRIIELIFANITINHKGDVALNIKDELQQVIKSSKENPEGEHNDVVIGFGTGGSPVLHEPINVHIFNDSIKVNIHRRINKYARLFYTEFRSFMIHKDYHLDKTKAFSIRREGLIDMNFKKSYPRNKQIHTLCLAYLKKYYDLNSNLSAKLLNNEGITIKNMTKILEKVNSNLDEYLNFLRDIRGFTFLPSNNQLLIASLDTKEIKDTLEAHVTIFKQKVFCGCGQLTYRDTSNSQTSYRCRSKSARDRKILKVDKCDYPYLKENDILDRIEDEIGIRIKSPEESKKYIDKIVQLNHDNEFKIIYK